MEQLGMWTYILGVFGGFLVGLYVGLRLIDPPKKSKD